MIMENEVNVQPTKKQITKAEFEKKFEIEYCWLVRWEYMSPDDAKVKARKVVSSQYQY